MDAPFLGAPSLEVFKVRLDGSLSKRKDVPVHGRGVGLDDL